MGQVLQVFDQALGRRVALKLMRPGPPEALARFTREARAVARLQSEHVARVLDARITVEGQPYIAMEYLVGHTLKDHLRRNGAMTPDVAANYIAQACDALHEAHALGIVHRDIKPSNLFLAERRNGTRLIKVLDFGISKGLAGGETGASLTVGANIMGTPKYIAPERLQGNTRLDPRSDVWSLGAVLFELLTGEAPFVGATAAAVMAKIVSTPPPDVGGKRPDVPAPLRAIVAKCLESAPEGRFPSAGELGRALRSFASWNSQAVQWSPSAVNRPTRGPLDATDRVHVMNTPVPAGTFALRYRIAVFALMGLGVVLVTSGYHWWSEMKFLARLESLRGGMAMGPAPASSSAALVDGAAPGSEWTVAARRVDRSAAAPKSNSVPVIRPVYETDFSRHDVAAGEGRAAKHPSAQRPSHVESRQRRTLRTGVAPETLVLEPEPQARRAPPAAPRPSPRVGSGARPVGDGIELFDDIK
jgi:serine/threonine-protein kinase